MKVRSNNAISDWSSGILLRSEVLVQDFGKYQMPELKFTAKNHPEFTLVFNVFYQQLCHFSCKLLNDWDSAEDIVVEVFMRLWNTKGQFSSTGSLKRWLYKCTYNCCMNYLKTAKKSIYTLDDILESNNKLTEIENIEILKQIYLLIESLPHKCKAVMRLYYFDGFEYEGIAKLFNISISTVKNQRARGIYLIKTQLSKSGFKERC